jgi:hypothetical protein
MAHKNDIKRQMHLYKINMLKDGGKNDVSKTETCRKLAGFPEVPHTR